MKHDTYKSFCLVYVSNDTYIDAYTFVMDRIPDAIPNQAFVDVRLPIVSFQLYACSTFNE